MEFLDDDENVKAMRETALVTGLTDVLIELRREQSALQAALDRNHARITTALTLLGAEDER